MEPSEKIQELIELAESFYNDGNLKAAYDNYREAAIKGSGEASYRLGEFCEKGIYVKRSYTAAKQWYVIAASKGNVKAKERLKKGLPKDDYVEKDTSEEDSNPEPTKEVKESEEPPTDISEPLVLSFGDDETSSQGRERGKARLRSILIAVLFFIVGVSVVLLLKNNGGDSKRDDAPVVADNQGGSNGGHQYVDLGLPSGTLWATCNVGATNPWEYGDYFAWGETSPYYISGGSSNNPVWKSGKSKGYDWPIYKYADSASLKLTKYCNKSDIGFNGYTDSRTTLERSDDAATANWGSDWCMPTLDQIKELKVICTWTWTTAHGIKGHKVAGPNGNSLFFPAAGYRSGTDLEYVNSYGYCWSRSLGEPTSFYAWSLWFDASQVAVYSDGRCFARAVRPVRCR